MATRAGTRFSLTRSAHARCVRPDLPMLAAVFIVALAGCGKPLPIAPALVARNPYGFTTSDLAAARGERDGAAEVVSRLGASANPYRFRDTDVAYAAGLLEASTSRLAILQHVADTGDSTGYGNFFPGPDQIAAGLAYWGQQKTVLASQAIPYWQQQQSLANSSGVAAWSAFCVTMLADLDLESAFLDAALYDLQQDQLEQAGIFETPGEILQRKLAHQQAAMTWYADLVSTLIAGRDLVLLPPADIGALLAPADSIPSRAAWWTQDAARTRTTAIPFFEAESLRAAAGENRDWQVFCAHMLGSLRHRGGFADSLLADIETDAAVWRGDLIESAALTVERKLAMAGMRGRYYSELVGVLAEGMSLGVASPGGARAGSAPDPYPFADRPRGHAWKLHE